MTELKYNGQYVFRTQRSAINPKSTKKEKEDKKVNNAEKTIINQLAAGILARKRDEQRQLAAAQPDPPPAVILEPTEGQKEVERHYAKPGTITTNANGVEAYDPPPCILAPLGEEEK